MDLLIDLFNTIPEMAVYLLFILGLLLFLNLYMAWRYTKNRLDKTEKDLEETTITLARTITALEKNLETTLEKSLEESETKERDTKPEMPVPDTDQVEEVGEDTIEKGLRALLKKVSALEQAARILKGEVLDGGETIPQMRESLAELRSKAQQDADTMRLLEEHLITLPNGKMGNPDDSTGDEEQALRTMVRRLLILERSLLKDTWNLKSLENSKKVLYGLLQDNEEHKDLFGKCFELESLIISNKALATVYSRAMEPMRSFYDTLQEFLGIQEILKDKLPEELELSEYIKELMEVRMKTHFLVSLREGDSVSSLAEFRVEDWVKESFLGFADRFLREYQRALLSGTVSDDLIKGYNMVMEVLGTASIRPIRVVLGETQFDGNVHVGRSYTNEPSISNGTIADVVKSGFETLTGETIQQPEVIVNRI